MSTKFILIILWYIIGVVTGLVVCWRNKKHITIGDVAFSVSICGMAGFIFFFSVMVVWIFRMDFWNKKLF